MTSIHPLGSEDGPHTAPLSRRRYYVTAPAEYCSLVGTTSSSHPRPAHQPTLQSLGSGLETHGTSESPDRPASAATSLQRSECDRGRRSFAKADRGHVSRTTSATEPENGASARGRGLGPSSLSSSCSERMFVSQRWWASQRQSNGGILEVRPPKNQMTTGRTSAAADAPSAAGRSSLHHS